MKIDLFENQYKPSNVAKIIFADIVCFLLVAMITLGVCYAYLSGQTEVSGGATTAKVDIQYQYKIGDSYVPVNDIYIKLNNETAVKTLSSLEDPLTPGDKITILGRAVSQSDVGVYMLAKLEIETVQQGVEKTEVVWFNIGSNEGKDEDEVNASTAIQLSTQELTTADGTQTHNVHTIGAGVLADKQYKELSIEYKFDGDKYFNGDEITNIKFSLHAHQMDHLENASDFDLYQQYADQITGYDIKSIYATHYITGTQLKRK